MDATKPDTIILGMGCFWGAEKRMAELAGVIDVESGYANGEVAGNYEAVLAHERALRFGLSRQRNHAEVVKVTFDPAREDLETVLIRFWESHDPTQGDRQGNDIGSNYRSAIYTTSEMQRAIALKTRDIYQRALTRAGFGKITTEILPLTAYYRAEDYHQDYLWKNPDGYCGLGGTGVPYPRTATGSPINETPRKALDATTLDSDLQLIVFEAPGCPSCRQFATEIVDRWESDVPVARTLGKEAPAGWGLKHPILATPTTVLFKQRNEVGRFTGYEGDPPRFWQWLGSLLLTPEQYEIAFSHGTECAFTGPHLKEKRPGRFVDPITGATLFRSDAKFESGTGWPSFFRPEEGAITLHEDESYGMRRIEVRSASSGIHLGHVFDDGPAPTFKRYCINGKVLKFVPDNG
ncbi:peptide-methionine (S)-S-oxide reductase MsrA [Propionivibrio limicola]|uniref:peptide-methionine (S)-S-oxide reductase MsrA n=1 Tax=Propionivibrio limicola TaxID=167645 RepID=UPI001291AD71|nr:peptide-methionine (S)-S-oxide reductase MsrA [Propionivibrio limicola]